MIRLYIDGELIAENEHAKPLIETLDQIAQGHGFGTVVLVNLYPAF
jgi:hypothetical protein